MLYTTVGFMHRIARVNAITLLASCSNTIAIGNPEFIVAPAAASIYVFLRGKGTTIQCFEHRIYQVRDRISRSTMAMLKRDCSKRMNEYALHSGSVRLVEVFDILLETQGRLAMVQTVASQCSRTQLLQSTSIRSACGSSKRVKANAIVGCGFISCLC